MTTTQLILTIIAVVLSLSATVLLFIFILPKKKEGSLKGFAKLLHDFCSFKFYTVEFLLKALYIFSTSYVVIKGIFDLFETQDLYYTTEWVGYYAFYSIFIVPIIIRVVYELISMAIKAMKNIVSMNSKLQSQGGVAPEEVFPSFDASNYSDKKSAKFCAKCGKPLVDGKCTNEDCK